MNMKRVVVLAFVLLLMSCDKEKLFDGITEYTDDFEDYTVLDELLIEDDVNWSFTQITRPANGVFVDTTFSYSGQKSLRFEGDPSDDDGASKASIAKQNFAFWEGETVRLSARYFIEGENQLEWLFLMDLEERTPVGAGPGMRLALVDGQLLVEHKYNEPNIIQNGSLKFPRNEWVQIDWELKLSQKEEGTVRVWQNGELIIEKLNHRTLPSDILYFQQGTKGQYNSCEIGVTANSEASFTRLWVDDVSFQKVN